MSEQPQDSGTMSLGQDGGWQPVAGQLAQQMLAAIHARGRMVRVRRLRLVVWLQRRAPHIRVMAGFQPLNLHWYRPEWPSMQAGPAGQSLWRHEYVVRTVTVPQSQKPLVWDSGSRGSEGGAGSALSLGISSRRNGANDRLRGFGDDTSGFVMPAKVGIQERASMALDGVHWYDSRVEAVLVPSVSVKGAGGQERAGTPGAGDGLAYAPRLVIQSGKLETRIAQGQSGLVSHGAAGPALVLAASAQPRQEVSPSRYLAGGHGPALAPVAPPELPQALADEAVASRPARSPPADEPSSSFVDDLFDRAMRSQLLPGLDLQCLPSSPTPARGQSPATAGVSAPPAPAVHPVAKPNPGPMQFSRDDVTRVADRVAQLLAQRERFERERRGGV